MILYNELGFFYSTKISPEFFHGFTSKSIGDGRSDKTISDFLKKQGYLYNRILSPKQSHGTNIYVENKVRSNENVVFIDSFDGLISKTPGTILNILTADCVPIVYSDKINKLIAISHQGWRGTLAKFPEKVVNKMVNMGSKKENITVAIGPAIGDCCYEVDHDLFFKFRKKFGNLSEDISGIKPFLNLAKINYKILLESGLHSESIDRSSFCTSCQSDKFWSYRRDGKIRGEMISFITIRL